MRYLSARSMPAALGRAQSVGVRPGSLVAIGLRADHGEAVIARLKGIVAG